MGIELDPAGFNQVCMTRNGPMLYNRNDRYIGPLIAKYGEFSKGEQDLFRQIVKPGHMVIEAGANIGAHTVLLSQLAGEGKVIAFEPQRLVYQTLCANIALNQCRNVYALQAAVGAECGKTEIADLDPTRPNTSFGSLSLADRFDGVPTEIVPLMSIDSLGMAYHVLKVDVEGMECEVIRGASESIKACRPCLYVENDREDKSSELIGLIFGLDYALYWHAPLLYSRDNFNRVEENIFPDLGSVNLLGLPSELKVEIIGLPQITSPESNWHDAMALTALAPRSA